MLSRENYITMSISSNLFWLRIMKEHAIFIESSIPPIHSDLAKQADGFKQEYGRLLLQTIRMANGVLTKETLQTGQYFTQFTEVSEQAVQKFTGIPTESSLTQSEYQIEPYLTGIGSTNEQEISSLNESILKQTASFAKFKSELLNNQVSCKLFTFLYSADIDHILREALRYIDTLNRLQNRNDDIHSDFRQFWNNNMSDHAKSMRGLFDPTETSFFNTANQFVYLYEGLIRHDRLHHEEDLIDAKQIRDFKSGTTQGLIECKVKAIMSPLYTDHLLREANHYIYLLQS
ncbi:DUF2935 domain-containing protein [Caproiciproducens sp. R1]|uniref:DUF2935 domain-containing protein n=1 Tax=Caproiciproducens sp. R1 TaxID=3435000 RepID=UPI00403445F0